MFLLILLLLALLGSVGLGSSHSSSSGTATVPAPMHVAFTVDGKPVDARGEPSLRPGQVLQFAPTVHSFTLRRLECGRLTHTIKLDARRRWRVADLAEGIYAIQGRGRSFSFTYLVRVRNHAAPCPGP